MDTLGKLDTAYSYNTLCNTNGIALCSSRSESFASGGDSIRFQSNRYADSGGTDRPSFPVKSVGTGSGSHTAAGYFIVFGKPECSRTGMAVIIGNSRSGRCHFESGGG